MPRIRLLSFTQPAVRPLAYGLAATGGALAIGYAGSQILGSLQGLENSKNPPLQVESFDADPSKVGDEGTAVFDRKTGRLLVYATAPAVDKVGPERSQEREIKTGLMVAGAVALGITAILVFAKKGGR